MYICMQACIAYIHYVHIITYPFHTVVLNNVLPSPPVHACMHMFKWVINVCQFYMLVQVWYPGSGTLNKH